MIPESKIQGNDRMIAMALFETLLWFIVMSVAHEVGHWVFYELTHEQSATIAWGTEGFLYILYPTPADQFTLLISWGGFIGITPFLVLYLRFNIFAKIMSSMLILYSFAEGMNAVLGYVLGPYLLSYLAVFPVYIGAVVWLVLKQRSGKGVMD